MFLRISLDINVLHHSVLQSWLIEHFVLFVPFRIQADVALPSPKQPVQMQNQACTNRCTTLSKTRTIQKISKAATMVSVTPQVPVTSGVVILVFHRVIFLLQNLPRSNLMLLLQQRLHPSRICSMLESRKPASSADASVKNQNPPQTIGTA